MNGFTQSSYPASYHCPPMRITKRYFVNCTIPLPLICYMTDSGINRKITNFLRFSKKYLLAIRVRAFFQCAQIFYKEM